MRRKRLAAYHAALALAEKLTGARRALVTLLLCGGGGGCVAGRRDNRLGVPRHAGYGALPGRHAQAPAGKARPVRLLFGSFSALFDSCLTLFDSCSTHVRLCLIWCRCQRPAAVSFRWVNFCASSAALHRCGDAVLASAPWMRQRQGCIAGRRSGWIGHCSLRSRIGRELIPT